MARNQQIFSEDIPLVNKPEEVKSLFKQYPKLDREYIVSAADASNRKRMEANWQLFRPYADEAFVSSLKVEGEFRRRLWEMELGCVLLRKGYKLLPKVKGVGPDLRTENFDIECVVPGGGEGEHALAPPIADGQMREVPHGKIKLRIASAFVAKHQQFLDWEEAGVVDSTRPRVIAINLGALGWWPMMERGELSAVEEVVFGVGPESVTINVKTGKVTNVSRTVEIQIPKGNKEVDVAYFNGTECKDIAAVISAETMFVEPEHLEVVYNPVAVSPLDPSFFDGSKQMIWKPKGGRLYREVIHPT